MQPLQEQVLLGDLGRSQWSQRKRVRVGHEDVETAPERPRALGNAGAVQPFQTKEPQRDMWVVFFFLFFFVFFF